MSGDGGGDGASGEGALFSVPLALGAAQKLSLRSGPSECVSRLLMLINKRLKHIGPGGALASRARPKHARETARLRTNGTYSESIYNDRAQTTAERRGSERTSAKRRRAEKCGDICNDDGATNARAAQEQRSLV